MDLQPAIPARAAPACTEPAPARSPIERQIAMLEALAELCMEVAQATGQRVLAQAAAASPSAPASGAEDEAASAVAVPAVPAVPGDPVLAFARVSRAVRMTVGLWSQLTREQQAQEAAAARGALEDRLARAADRRVRAERIVERVAQDHFEVALPGKDNDDEAIEAVGRALREARERLADEELYGDLADRPFSEIVARICGDLGVTPDWAQLSGEYWAQQEIAQMGGVAGAAPGVLPPRPPPSAARRRRRSRAGDAAPPTLRVRFIEPLPFESPTHPGAPSPSAPPDPRQDPPGDAAVEDADEGQAAHLQGVDRMQLAELGPGPGSRVDRRPGLAASAGYSSHS